MVSCTFDVFFTAIMRVNNHFTDVAFKLLAVDASAMLNLIFFRKNIILTLLVKHFWD